MKGLDKYRFEYIDTHIQITCVVCHTTWDDFPGTSDKSTSDALVFSCPKCQRYYRLMVAITPLRQEEIDKILNVGITKTNRISFKDLL